MTNVTNSFIAKKKMLKNFFKIKQQHKRSIKMKALRANRKHRLINNAAFRPALLMYNWI